MGITKSIKINILNVMIIVLVAQKSPKMINNFVLNVEVMFLII